jgi:hypothetical protein
MPIKITQLPTLEAPQTYFRDLSPLDAFTIPGMIDGTVKYIGDATAVDRVEMAINWRRQA